MDQHKANKKNESMLSLAIRSQLPLIYVKTDDLINIESVLSYIANGPAKAVNLPEVINKVSDLQFPGDCKVFYTTSKCTSLVKLYHYCVDKEISVVFVNTEQSVLQFDGGTMIPPKELVLEFLSKISDTPDELLPSFGGLNLKDVGEIAKMTMTRDADVGLTPRGVAETRRGYRKLRGITQVDTSVPYYVCPTYLSAWLGQNTKFFTEPVHPSLIPRGLLFPGPPGTGKTLASKYIAQTFGVPLYRLDLGSMMGKYVGESENNLNAALAQIDEVEPCVVILDEVEKVFQGNGDSGVTQRLLSQLLWWLQEHKTKVFTVMTTNNKDKIPEELYREGRIDAVMNFLGIDDVVEAMEFGKGAFDSMLLELDASADEASYAELNKRVKALYFDGGAVPQAKITSTVNAYVKEVMCPAPDTGAEDTGLAPEAKAA